MKQLQALLQALSSKLLSVVVRLAVEGKRNLPHRRSHHALVVVPLPRSAAMKLPEAKRWQQVAEVLRLLRIQSCCRSPAVNCKLPVRGQGCIFIRTP